MKKKNKQFLEIGDKREHFWMHIWEKLRRKVNGYGKLVIKEEILMSRRLMVWFGKLQNGFNRVVQNWKCNMRIVGRVRVVKNRGNREKTEEVRCNGGWWRMRGRTGFYPLFQRHHCHHRKWHEHSPKSHRCKLQGFLHLLKEKERPMKQCRRKQWQPLQERGRERERVEEYWFCWFESEWKVRREGGTYGGREGKECGELCDGVTVAVVS